MLATRDVSDEQSVRRYERVVQLMREMRTQGATIVAIANRGDNDVAGIAHASIELDAATDPVNAISEVIPLQMFGVLHRGRTWCGCGPAAQPGEGCARGIAATHTAFAIIRSPVRNWLLLIWRCVIRMIAVAIAAAMLSWPALWNGLALLYPDSLEYLSLSRAIVWRLRGYQFPLILNRSAIFYWWMSLWNDHALWPIVAVQAVLMAWVLWLVVRAFARQRPVPSYLASVALLAIFTSVGWFVSYVMADVYGPMLYLAVFLLVFAADTLRWWERVGLYLIALLGVVFALDALSGGMRMCADCLPCCG